jgi:ribosomal protein S7
MKKVINQLITRLMMNSKTKLAVQKFAEIFKQIDMQ